MAVVMMAMAMMHPVVFGIVFHARTLHMVVMAHLRRAQVVLVADDLFAVFAQLAIHVALAGQCLFHARDERVDHFGVIVEV